ncbi:L-seryl-tRNA(Sec) selenium transferase [Desulfuribacillus alkaliarsenatis]|uniref:L-seryl-tRNA(Sec) selenium transferase n=1 Tax=Desulfuribacillus alkaliarsenatis TaxID=766136 RepID=A0A1E5FZF2_9FIRM|nr:L-seryl-tRNA(Sec) selenium transferase [Desulfuribacillus alkaliarsenatis]OEF95950.1 L-seryl-tRNA(Sec) selenium transferase [Desulfuribacillus alkaliarsenatis]
MNEKYRMLPAVGKLLQHPTIKEWQKEYPLSKISQAAAKLIDEMRDRIAELLPEEFEQEAVLNKLKANLDNELEPNLKRVINATGVVLHTNLGRALLSEDAVNMVAQVARSYNNLELNLDTGKRGSRYSHVEELICELTGAEAALVVNNNASAVLLVLRELGSGGEVIVSRGELVEIGGSFRVSEVMKESKAQLVEVGTTNKTHLYDYEDHVTEHTKLLMKVHTSNYRIVGFTKSVESEELVSLGRKTDIPVYEDLGSGMLYDLKSIGVGDEPTVQEVVKAGVDVVSFSGDKLLGGPQAGIIVGRKKYIDRIKKNQLNRALRVDKFTVAALQATLLHYVKEEYTKIPTLRMIMGTEDSMLEKANLLAEQIKAVSNSIEVEVQPGFSQIGGGALPLEQMPTYVVALSFADTTIARAVELMREASYPIMPRVSKEQILLDVRTIADEEFSEVVISIKEIIEKTTTREV